MENLNIDQIDLSELGVERKGTFNVSGMPEGWSIDLEKLGNQLPRQLLNQPVLTIADTGNVFLRGLFSKKLTEERELAMVN